MISYEETLSSAVQRLRADTENCYNTLMKIKFVSLRSEQIELLREVERLSEKIHKYCVETIKEYQK